MLFNRLSLIAIYLVSFTMLLNGCATSRLAEKHPDYASSNEPYAEVVFFRPMPQRTRGIADNDVTIEIDKQVMAELSAGEYIVVKLKPGETKITLKNMTYITYKVMPEEVFRARKFIFEPNQRYFIQTRLKVEEYRGVYFEPREVEEAKALEILTRLKPVNQPIS